MWRPPAGWSSWPMQSRRAMSEKARHKSGSGNFFEDFHLGQEIIHPTPRTITLGDQALYNAIYGPRFPFISSDEFARAAGLARAPIDGLLTFHVVFGKSVPDISLNAIANLGYADCLFAAPTYPGDTVSAASRVIGIKENSNHKTGTLYVHTTGRNQRGEVLVEFIRWVMVAKRDPQSPAPETVVPELPAMVPLERIALPGELDLAGYDLAAVGSEHLWQDYGAGERIDHIDGATVEEVEHMMATRLYQNTARVHFDAHAAHGTRFGRRVVYGGHVISVARSLSFNGLANAFRIIAINGGRHVAPLFAGDTVYAWTEVVETMALPGRGDIGALRLRTVAAKDQPCADHPHKGADGAYHPAVVLDLDYTVLMPRRR